MMDRAFLRYLSEISSTTVRSYAVLLDLTSAAFETPSTLTL